MREDHSELLESMFPKGFMIVYIKPNDEPQIAWFNPLNDPIFEQLEVLIGGQLEDNSEFN